MIRRQAEDGFAEDARQFLRTSFVQPENLQAIVVTLAELGDTVHLKQFIHARAEDSELTATILGCLIGAYPKQARPVRERLLPLLV